MEASPRQPQENELELLTPPRRELVRLIKRRGAITIDEACDALEQSKTATRAHLLHLEERGIIKRGKPATEGRGRPPLTFRLTGAGQSLFPRDDAEVLTDLLRFLEEQGQRALLREFFEKLWAERREEFARELAAQPGDPGELSTRLAALDVVLRRSHFMPSFERVTARDSARELSAGDEISPRDALRLRECNCPFPAVVRATRIPCALEVAFIAEVFQQKPSEVRFMHQGHDACIYDFAPRQRDSSDEE